MILTNGISIHAPRVGSDRAAGPARAPPMHFYPRSPRGERLPHSAFHFLPNLQFLSTLPAWGATREMAVCRRASGFLSTLPAWGATDDRFQRHERRNISIHAPRVGSDAKRTTTDGIRDYFYPRSPRGERQGRGKSFGGNCLISIHAPRVGSDFRPIFTAMYGTVFLSTLPAWGATGWFSNGKPSFS